MMKKLALLALALSLTACGFKPVHSVTKFESEPAFKNIKVELIEPERISQREAGYFLQQDLFARMGENAGPHILKIKPRTRRTPYGLTSNDVASRFDLVLTVNYDLVNSVDGKVLDKGRVSATTTFGSSRDPYARITAEQSAAEQVARNAADRLMIRLASYYNDTP